MDRRMPVRSLFVTQLYEAELGNDDLLGELAHSVRALADDDAAGMAPPACAWARGMPPTIPITAMPAIAYQRRMAPPSNLALLYR